MKITPQWNACEAAPPTALPSIVPNDVPCGGLATNTVREADSDLPGDSSRKPIIDELRKRARSAPTALPVLVYSSPPPSTSKGSIVFESELGRMIRQGMIAQLILTPMDRGWAVQMVLERTMDTLTLVSLRKEIRRYKDLDRLFDAIRKHGPVPPAICIGEVVRAHP